MPTFLSRERSSVGLAFVVTLGVGFVAYAQLGGSNGIVLPYQGTLFQGETAVNGIVDLSFDVFNQANGGSACQTIDASDTAVFVGKFNAQLALDDACVRGKDVWLAIAIDGNAINTRQRVFPALSALTSGAGDFHVTGHLGADTADINGSLVAGSLASAGELSVDGMALIRTGSTETTSIEAGKSLLVTGSFGSGENEGGGVEFRHDNLSQGIGFGYNTIYATGDVLNQSLSLKSRGSGPLHLNPNSSAMVTTNALSRTGGTITSYTRSLQRYKFVAPFTTSIYRSYTPIPEDVLASYCGDGDGCSITIRMENYTNAANSQTAASRGPFHFDYGRLRGNVRTWRMSEGDALGIDGDNVTKHAYVAWDCFFTDGFYTPGTNANSDTGRGFGLLNTGSSYSATCSLIIDD